MTEINKLLFPDTERIFSRIVEHTKLPHRRTGTPEGLKSAEYIKSEFEKIGLEQVKIEAVEALCFNMDEAKLTVNGKEFSAFLINCTFHKEEVGTFETGKEYEDIELIYLGEGSEKDFEGVDVKGKLVLCDCPWFDMDEDGYATEWCSNEAIVYDPDADSREKVRKTDSYSPNAWPYNYIMAQKNGALGFVGILNDYFEDGIEWNEDYTEIGNTNGLDRLEIPGVWVGTTAAAGILSELKNNKAKASLYAKAYYFNGEARNVSGILPGMSDDIILVHSHHDAVFSGAVQDASGMSEVMALAEYFSKLEKEERLKTLIFAGFDGHYTDYEGHRAFINKLATGNSSVIADCVIEHVGKEAGIDEHNNPIIKDYPEIRLCYVSNRKELVDVVKNAFVKNEVKRTVMLPVDDYVAPEDGKYEFAKDEVISDAYYSHLAGFRIVSLLSPPMYLFHPMDTPDMVPKEELVPIGLAFAEIITRIAEMY